VKPDFDPPPNERPRRSTNMVRKRPQSRSTALRAHEASRPRASRPTAPSDLLLYSCPPFRAWITASACARIKPMRV
jgi:hypothetical protein